MKRRAKKRYPKLKSRQRKLASKFISEEMRTKKYPRKQAIAIGIARARKAGGTGALYLLKSKLDRRAK